MQKDKYIFTALFDESNVLSKILVAVKIDISSLYWLVAFHRVLLVELNISLCKLPIKAPSVRKKTLHFSLAIFFQLRHSRPTAAAAGIL
jgi:hypothetical protein